MTKSEFRKNSKQILKKYSKIGKLTRDRYLFLRLKEAVKVVKPKSILLYVSLDIEFDTKKLIKYCKRDKIKVYVPFMDEISFKMVEYRLPLIKKDFGIYEPKSLNFKFPKVDMAVVPIIGVDKKLRRIGFGKGMYDRFFENINIIPYTIFVQRSFCYIQKRVTKDHDIRANLIITPEKTIILKGDRYGSRADSNRNRISFGCRSRILFGGKKAKCR